MTISESEIAVWTSHNDQLVSECAVMVAKFFYEKKTSWKDVFSRCLELTSSECEIDRFIGMMAQSGWVNAMVHAAPLVNESKEGEESP